MNRLRMLWLAAPGVIAALAAAVLVGGCNSGGGDVWPPNKSPRVLAFFPPLYCFARNVAGDDAAVLSLLTTTGPHDYQPSSRDSLLLRRADLFLINGLELDDHLAGRLKNASGNRQLRLAAVGESIPRQQLRKFSQTGHGHAHHGHDHHGHDHGHVHGEYDPHVWLGIPEAVCMVGRIRDELKTVNPSRAKEYDQRAADYVARLKNLQAEGKAALAGKAHRKLITFHESLQYFARSFDLTVVGTIELRPGSEPDARQISELIKVCKDQNVSVIAVEPQYPSNTSAKTLLQELQRKELPHAKLVIVDPLETAGPEELQDPGFYERKMRQNLKNLAEALP